MTRNPLSPLAIAIAAALSPAVASASVIGFLGNFDVVNDTGRTAHGFEIELEDLHLSDITDTFGGAGRGFPSGRGFNPATAVERYGAPTLSEFVDGSRVGVRVTYQGSFDGANWDFGTPSGVYNATGEGCWTHGGSYGPGTPCDHFGVGVARNATRTLYSWLVEGLAPGTLDKISAALPAPVWDVVPAPVDPGVPVDPAVPPAPPVVAAIIEAPEGEDGSLFGPAMWVKVFTTEVDEEIDLEDLIAGNPVIDGAETEVEWQLLQHDPGNPDAGRLEAGYGAPVGENAASIIRRYEFYAYTGAFKDDNEADPLDGDSHPADGEVGSFLGAQNGAALLGDLAPVAPVPVPAAAWLFGSGLLGLVSRRRRG
jgi:hypothetical protein